MTIAKATRQQILMWGMDARCAENFQDILPEFEAYEPHLVLLDIVLPFFNGYHWCSRIRQISRVPVVFISSASDSMNIVMAMNMGGDDFIAKPFELSVLIAKLQAVLRRTYDFDGTGDDSLIRCRGAVLNKDDATLTFGGTRIELTRNDYRILLTLLENCGRVVSRDLLMQKLWETDSFIDENTLTVNIMRLRRKLADIGLEDFITTRKGMGYLIE